VSFATIASMFFSVWPHCDGHKRKPESIAPRRDASDCPDDQLLRSQMELTWCLAKLALEPKSDRGVRASSDAADAMEAALKKAERYSLQTPQNGLALTNLNSLKQAIAGMRLDVHPRAAGTSQGRFGIAPEVTR
jgi:hypothetical protein